MKSLEQIRADEASLRERAAAATQPGPWTVEKQGDSFVVLDANGCWVADCGCAPDDAAFIAAASPDVVLAILDRIDALEAEKASRRQQNALVAVAVERHHADCGATMCSPLCGAVHDPEAAHTARELCIAAARDEEVERAMREGFETAVDSAEICHEATCEHEGLGSHINWTEARRDLEERISTLRGVGK